MYCYKKPSKYIWRHKQRYLESALGTYLPPCPLGRAGGGQYVSSPMFDSSPRVIVGTHRPKYKVNYLPDTKSKLIFKLIKFKYDFDLYLISLLFNKFVLSCLIFVDANKQTVFFSYHLHIFVCGFCCVNLFSQCYMESKLITGHTEDSWSIFIAKKKNKMYTKCLNRSL